MTRYYLNNPTEETITIRLTAVRTIKPYSSQPLNDKDVQIYKTLRSKNSKLAARLSLSKIKIEDDTRYAGLTSKKKETKSEKPKNQKVKESSKGKDNDKKPEDSEGKQPEDSEGKQPESLKGDEEDKNSNTSNESKTADEATEDAIRKSLESKIDSQDFI